ncbi:MAG: marine proteobacterial sortase target protein [Nitrospiraceae bacterium]
MQRMPSLLHQRTFRSAHVIFFTLVLCSLSTWPCVAATIAAEATEQEQGMRPSEATQGTLLLRIDQAGHFIPAPALHTDVQITVTGLIARATVKQEFSNPSKEWAEGLYVFPLPETAAVDHLRMTVGERIIEGMIKERTDAKKTYEQAKSKGKRASLVEQERLNIFTTSVANIGPHDRITVEIDYQETVRYDQQQFHLRFPMVVSPRYIPGLPVIIEDQPPGPGWARDSDRVPDASRITPPVQHPDGRPINPVTLTLDLAPGFPVGNLESTSHPIIVVPEADGRRHISLRENSVPADRDFQLTWQPASGHDATATVFTEQIGGDSYAFFMVMPPIRPKKDSSLPREAIFVIDTSGSMSGESMQQAKAALLLALSRLTAADRFNVIQFNSVTHVLFSQPQPVRIDTMRKAVHFVEGLVANGGTEMLPALKRALDHSEVSQRLRQVVFLTDGQIGNEEELFGVIRERLGTSRLFTIGIGSAPNSHFMRKAAEFGRGTFTYINHTSDVKEKMDALFRKLEHPVLTEITVNGLAADGLELFPSRIPDLYEGEPIVVAIKCRSLPDELAVHGLEGSTPWTARLSLKQATPRSGLSVYWARQKIASLLDQRPSTQDESTIRQSVIDVALRHHLVSKYTSLVAIDPTPARSRSQVPMTHALKTNLPAGQDYVAIFGLPKTGTNGQRQVLLGLIALTAALTVWLAKRRMT